MDDDEGVTLLPALAVLPGHLLWRAAARVTTVAADGLPAGVDVHSYATLLALKGHVVRSQQDLADGIGVSRTTMTRLARGLGRDGLVERVRNEGDRRSYALSRTAAGDAAEQRWRDHVLGLEHLVSPSMTEAERDGLRSLLGRVVVPHLTDQTPAELRGALGFLVVKSHLLLHREALAALTPWRLEPRHLGASTALRALGPVPQVALARALGVTPTSTVQIVDDMERLGLVVRRRAAHDRRVQELHLADDADQTLRPAGRAVGGAVARLLAVLDEHEQQRLVVLLRRLVTAP